VYAAQLSLYPAHLSLCCTHQAAVTLLQVKALDCNDLVQWEALGLVAGGSGALPDLFCELIVARVSGVRLFGPADAGAPAPPAESLLLGILDSMSDAPWCFDGGSLSKKGAAGEVPVWRSAFPREEKFH